jgi:ABC-2 type transport system ATP-binding protein
VGVLTETPGMYDNLSAEYNLRIYAELYEVKDVTGQVEKYLRMLGLWERRDDPAGTFSKGMKQKLAIARAMIHEPHLLFLDEPTSGLDPEAAHLVRDFIAELRKEGRTIFLCTHNLDEADRLCDRIGVFKSRLLVVDTPEKLRQSSLGARSSSICAKLTRPWPLLQLRKLAFVQEARAVENKIVVTWMIPKAHNPDIVRALVAQGADIRFVGELRHSPGRRLLATGEKVMNTHKIDVIVRKEWAEVFKNRMVLFTVAFLPLLMTAIPLADDLWHWRLGAPAPA